MSAGVLKTLVVTATIAGGASGWAQSCSLINQGASEVHDAAGAAISLPAPQVSSCAGLRVLKGAVVACTVTARSRSMCQTFTAGQTLTEGELRRGPGGAGPWYTFGDMLRGSPGRITAVSRGREARSLPTGPVVLLQPVAIEPDFDRDPALRGIAGVEVHEGSAKGLKLATLSAHGTRKLLTRNLKPGQRYSWRIAPPPGSLPVTGEFTVLKEADRRQARTEAERVRAESRRDATAQAVMWAGWLASHRCEHEAAQVLSAAGFDVD